GRVVVQAEAVELAQYEVGARARLRDAAVLVRADDDRARGVDRLDVADQASGDRQADGGRGRVGDLVADRPQHDGGRVLRGVDHLRDVRVAVGVEEAPVVVLALGRAPGV